MLRNSFEKPFPPLSAAPLEKKPELPPKDGVPYDPPELLG
jgi:hypothetical protein